MNNSLFEETLILYIVSSHLEITIRGIERLCRERGYIITESKMRRRVVLKMVEENLLLRDVRSNKHHYPIRITKLGESRLLANRCLLRQLIP